MKRAIARREDIRDLILDGVEALLGRYGYRKMTMEDLARQVGIGKGTIYLHFQSKEELALSHVDRIADRVLARLREVADWPEPADVRLRTMLLDRILIRFAAVSRYPESLNELLSSIRGELIARRNIHFEREAGEIASVLEDGVVGRTFDCAQFLETARALVWSTNSLLPFSLSGRELGEPGEMEMRAGRIVDVLMKGLIARRTPRSRPAWGECEENP